MSIVQCWPCDFNSHVATEVFKIEFHLLLLLLLLLCMCVHRHVCAIGSTQRSEAKFQESVLSVLCDVRRGPSPGSRAYWASTLRLDSSCQICTATVSLAEAPVSLSLTSRPWRRSLGKSPPWFPFSGLFTRLELMVCDWIHD